MPPTWEYVQPRGYLSSDVPALLGGREVLVVRWSLFSERPSFGRCAFGPWQVWGRYDGSAVPQAASTRSGRIWAAGPRRLRWATVSSGVGCGLTWITVAPNRAAT